jgi:hypothetical protein
MPSGEEGGNGGGESSPPNNNKKESTPNVRKHQQRGGFQRNAIAPRQPKFEGKCDGLKGHIYDCSDVIKYSLTT